MTKKTTMFTRDAAAYLGIEIATMQRYIRDGLIPATLAKSGKRIAYEILFSDVLKLEEMRDKGNPVFRPGSNPKENGKENGKTLIYLPRSSKWASEITRILSPEERAIILEWYALSMSKEPELCKEEIGNIKRKLEEDKSI